MLGSLLLLLLLLLVLPLIPILDAQDGNLDGGDDTWRLPLDVSAPVLMPESHHEGSTTPWAKDHVIVTMYSTYPIHYTVDGTEPSVSSSKYTGEVTIDTPGVHLVRAVAINDDGVSSKESKAVYKVAKYAKGTAYDGYLDHCSVGFDFEEEATSQKSVVTFLDSYGRSWFELGTLRGLSRGYVVLRPDSPGDGCVCGIPKPTCCCDKSVGIPQMIFLRTPANATQLNPTTTIFSQLVSEYALTFEDAQARMTESWDLPGGYDVLSDDVLWLTMNPYLDVKDLGPRSLVRMAQAEVLACSLAMLLAGTEGLDWPNEAIASAVYSSVAGMSLLKPINFTSEATTRRAAEKSASSSSSSLSEEAVLATSKVVSKMNALLVALLERYYDDGGVAAASEDFSLPVEIAAVSREANTKVGMDINLLARGKLSLVDFESIHLAKEEEEEEEEEAELANSQKPPSFSDDENASFSDENASSSSPQKSLLLETWQLVLVGGVGAPLVFLAAVILVRRRRRGSKKELLNLVEEHNLLSSDDIESSQMAEWKRRKKKKKISSTTTTTSSSSTSTTTTSSNTTANAATTSGAGAAQSSSRDDNHSSSDDDDDDSSSFVDAFGASPQKIRHRPPKSHIKHRQQRQTLLFDQQRQTWHTPIEVGHHASNASTPEQSPKAKATVRSLHAIEEREATPPPPSPSPPAGHSPSPPPVTSSTTFMRRTKLYKPKS